MLSHHLAVETKSIVQDQYEALHEYLRILVEELHVAHQASFIPGGKGPTALDVDESSVVLSALEDAQSTCEIDHAEHSNRRLAAAERWVRFALAGVDLYVPSVPLDPALRPRIEHELFHQRRAALLARIDALQQFQRAFTGDGSSLRIREVEADVQALGNEPVFPAIVRPVVSVLDALYAEFTSLLYTVSELRQCIVPMDVILRQPSLRETLARLLQLSSRDQTLRQNLVQIIQRLTKCFRAYEDITMPAVGFLVAVNIALTMANHAQTDDSALARNVSYIAKHTPFLGLAEVGTSPDSVLVGDFQESHQRSQPLDLRWHALQSCVVISSMNQTAGLPLSVHNLVHALFLEFYGEWKVQLQKDREKEAANSSLYTYRDQEDEVTEEEDTELFPDYETKQESEHSESFSATSLQRVLRLAALHEKIFSRSETSAEAVKQLVHWSTHELGRLSEGQSHGTSAEETLPALFLALEQKADELSSSAGKRGLNFYFDANIPQARRFIHLIRQIQLRYRRIQRIWPEHATLSDVLQTCDEALAFRHVDPVAKFLTKAEKLHGYVYEWERVASKEFSTTPLYDELTKLLVSWRQLQLATWARLFDLEVEKCCNAAKAWFFVAYENVIVAPEAIAEDDAAIEVHSRELLRTLEGFFTSTTLGQFQQRIRLLCQLRDHVMVRAQRIESVQVVYRALDNFIAYFTRLEKPVEDAVRNGRKALEKEVNDVIRLASWKDTNIEALMQSAKTSHRKLSKLVRKLRALLNQPVAGLARQGFPEKINPIEATKSVAIVSAAVDPALLQVLDSCVPNWASRPTRFKETSTILSMMRAKATPNAETLDGASYIEDFVAELESSITQLQKATPQMLTEENKKTVQNLKAHKRRLFADTLKELRVMGFRSNHNSAMLDQQKDLASVLAHLPTCKEAQDGELFLHQLLNIMGQVRDVAREHSGDLSSSDVARCIGYLESMLRTTVRQRGILSQTSEAIEGLQRCIEQAHNLWAPGKYTAVRVSHSQAEHIRALESKASWLSVILDVGADIIAAQAKLGQLDFALAIDGLRGWSRRCETLNAAARQLPQLPDNVSTDKYIEHGEELRSALDLIAQDVSGWMETVPLAGPTLKQILPWTKLDTFDTDDDAQHAATESIESIGKQILAALDEVLGSTQDVEAALAEQPLSTNDASWLLQEEQAFAAALSALHGPYLAKSLRTILVNMQRLDHTARNSGIYAVSALFAGAHPILGQHLAISQFILARFVALHTATSRLAYRLAKSFVQVGSQGFCTPSEKSADQQAGKDDQLESGTGLGEGEGAEDISKDVGDEEDLEDLAQQDNREREGSLEEEGDAVDMGEQEMKGEMGDVEEHEDGSSEGEDDGDVESQIGDVDDLGPSAVDEKMWDGNDVNEDEDKEREGKGEVGKENQDEQIAASDEKKQKGEEQEEPQAEDEDLVSDAAEEEEKVGVGEAEPLDPHIQEEQALDLPEELDMGAKQGESEDEDMNDLESDKDEQDMDAQEEAQTEAAEQTLEPEESEADLQNQESPTGHVPDEDMDDGSQDLENESAPLADDQPRAEDAGPENDKDHTATEAGAGVDANEDAHPNQDASTNAAIHNDGSKGEASEQHNEATGGDGALSRPAHQEHQEPAGSGESAEEAADTLPFKKFGDALEQWHNRQRQIRDARKDESLLQQTEQDVNMADAEFEHMPDEGAKPDTQALGTADEELAKSLQQDMALPAGDEERLPAVPEQHADEDEGTEDVEMRDAEPIDQRQTETDGRPQAFIGERTSLEQQAQDMEDALPAEEDVQSDMSMSDVESEDAHTNLEPTPLDSDLPSREAARALWLQHEAATHTLSQTLTEHLRLILAPTLATKLRGDFRTGKRLNVKRIIPYVASGFKRDKIWLRRSQPAKRNYQVLLAIDDSRSMRDSGACGLALKTLAIIAKSLAMLDVGELGIVAFGEDVAVAHPLGRPFAGDAGVDVFQRFSFAKDRTDVRGLVDRGLGLFADARARTAPAGDVWQLMIVVSDGLCDAHDAIRRLVRRGREERVMVVVIVVDAAAALPAAAPDAAASPPATAGSPPPPPPRREKSSILDLQSVDISPSGSVQRWRYLDRFPFPWYLVVRDVAELPAVLSTALRQWFSEVVGSGAA